ncbi:MAG: 3-isopropylmalate dehydratase small subunit [Pyrinomonadaceae bacterium]|nr:3-isopropylmalate dehydratase small subunit [Pyrinomonadaceae bacterium]MBP6212134.1 3-isopropylmalate dehydratase small subunit [Pyrinomonadaceae bacterium]
MQAFTVHSGSSVPLLRSNIDTDQIIPKQFLKRIERTGYGEFLFWDWRYQADGTPNADFVLNDPRFSAATILLAGENFGCGSSREHAPWSLLDHGFRVIIAAGFADIFYNNSLKTGLLPVKLDIKDVEYLAALGPQAAITVDLTSQTVTTADGTFTRSFEIDPFRRHCLLNGLDDIGLTLQHETAITAYEKAHG